MLREVWFGKRTFYGISAEELHEQVVQGRRLEHVQNRREPPNEWRDLMQCFWNEALEFYGMSRGANATLRRNKKRQYLHSNKPTVPL